MKGKLLLIGCISLVASTALAAENPYAGQQDREIKALSAEDVQSYLSGKGMGFAKTAELNGYPGPAHVLTLEKELDLSTEQERATRDIFASMEATSIKFGRLLVDEERKLDGLFAAKRITPDVLTASLDQIGALQARIRAAHLEAHIAQAEVLTQDQTARYNRLRGYASSQPSPDHKGHHH